MHGSMNIKFKKQLFSFTILIDSFFNREGLCLVRGTSCIFKHNSGQFSFYRVNNDSTAEAALKFGSEAWVLKKGEEQRLEAAQMKFLRHLLGITKLDKEKN